MTVKEILIEYLTVNGYQGLCNECCGCGIADPDDFIPCEGEIVNNCTPAYLVKATESTEDYDKGDWIYSPDEPEAT
jgi:hypothetical protein